MWGTITDWAEGWLLDCRARGLSPNTIGYYRDAVKAMVKVVGDKPMAELTAEDLRAYLVKSFEDGLSPGGVAARWRAVRAFVRWVVREGGLEHDPTRKIKPPRVPEVDLPVVREWEVKKLLAAAEMGKNPLRDKALVMVLWDTGLRASEVLGLRVSDVKAEAVRVRRKGGAVQWVPVSLPTYRAILAYARAERPPSDHDALFLGRSGLPLAYDGLKMVLRRLAEYAGIPPKPPHAFRRGAAVAMVKNGMPSYALQAMLGHKSPVMTAHYVRLAEKDLKDLHREASPVIGLLRRP